MNIYFGKTLEEIIMVKKVTNIPQVRGGGQRVPRSVKEKVILGTTCFGSMDKLLCFLSLSLEHNT